MDIGSLFLSLGIKGTEKTLGALTGVKKGLSETASLSLEAKAGILGAMYALEQLFAASGHAGTELTNFNALTGQSVQTLQQYEYAARQVGVSNQEVDSSFKNLQSTMTKTLMGEGAPKGLARVSLLTGGLTQKDIQEYAKQPALLIQRLQEYAQKETNVGLRNETLKSFGLGENMVAALSRNAFRPEILKKAPTYSDAEVGKLDKANIAWSNLGQKIQMAVGHFNALHGGQLVSDISKIVDQVIRLTEAFLKLSDKLHFFEGIGKIFQGWSEIFKAVNIGVESLTNTTAPKGKGSPTIPDRGVPSILKDSFQGGENVILGMFGDLKDHFSSGSSIAPSMAKNIQSTQNNNVTVTNQFQHAGADHKKVGESVKQAIQEAHRQIHQQAYRQMHANAQGT